MQLSLFSADLAEPCPADLGGILAAHGHVARRGPRARLSILLANRWRADALVRECRVRDIPAEIREDVSIVRAAAGDPASVLLRTDWMSELAAVAQLWSRGAVKAVPADLIPGSGLLRCWTLAAGRPALQDGGGFLLGLDPHAPETFEPLAAACSRAGVAGSILGASSGRPAIRVVGHRRMMRLAELLGTAPIGAPAGAFPAPLR